MEQPVLNKMMPRNTDILNESYEQCEYCGYRLKEKDGQYVCTHCGRIYRVSYSTILGKYLEEIRPKTDRKKLEKKFIIGFIITCLIAVVIFIIFSGNFDFFDSKIQKLVKANNLQNVIDYESVTEVVQAEMPTEGSALPEGYSVVLLRHGENPEYEIALVNYAEEKMMLFDYGFYDPVETIYNDYIINLPEEQQIEHFTCLSGYIIKYGIDCLHERDIAKMYVKQAAPFYNIEDIRESLKWDAALTLQSRQDSKDFEDIKVIFDGQSAVPLYYTTMKKSLVRNPNWNYVDIDSLNSIQLEFFYNLWGPIFIEEETWYAYDEYLQKVPLNAPTYQQLEKELLKLNANKSGK